MTVTIKDLGIGKLRKQLAELGRAKIFVGVQGEDAKKIHPDANGATVAEVAAWNHYGTRSIPARPYVDRAITALRKRSFPAMQKAIASLVDGRASTVGQALAPLGEMAVEQVTHEIDTATQWAAPLAASTIAAKGHDRPLVDTGTLRHATSYTVRVGSSIIGEGRGPGG